MGTKTLLLDLGNTRIKWGWQQGDELAGFGSLAHHGDPLGSGLADLLSQAPRVLISSVLGKTLNLQLQQWCAQHPQIGVQWARSEASFGRLVNGYQQPTQLGMDRWLAMIGAEQHFRGNPLCVVSCGTAVTIDAVSPQAQHMGGMIVPGLAMMRQSLLQGTQGIQLHSEPSQRTMFARNTTEAVDAGCHYAICGAINEMMAKLSQEYDEMVKCILTGGDAAEIKLLLGRAEVVECPHLVLQGLALWGQKSESAC